MQPISCWTSMMVDGASMAMMALIFLTTTSLCGDQGRIRIGHTCILFIVKSKRGSMEKQIMQSRSKGASVHVDRWMDGFIDVTYSLG